MDDEPKNPADAEREIFLEALECESPEGRATFLDRACANDPTTRLAVETLFKHHKGDEFMQPPGLKTALLPVLEDTGDRIGRYKLLERVGEGGCGVVYVAEQTEPVRRRVALKVIKLGMDTKAVVARFESERQALAMMDHPNIAKVLDAGTTEQGRPYFVMELVRGTRITEYCDEANLSTKERLDLFIKVCQAIQHAHQKGIIHRDIKPSNILVTLHDGVPVPKVIDFGIAKATEGRLTDLTVYTQLHQFIGTPAYMSPEQAERSGLDIDTRSDIYSLGVLLYELLVGSTPFNANELMASGLDAMRKTIREKEPVRPSTKVATLQGEALTATAKHRSVDTSKLANLLRGDLDWIVMRCLEKDRSRRYETANGLAADLKRHLNDEPVVARPPSAAYRFQKAFRRNRLLFTAAMAVAAALVAGIGVSTWQLLATRKAQREEEIQRRQAENQGRRADAQARKTSESQQESRRLLYASDMNLAQQALKLNDLGKARRLLDRHRPQPGEEDLRGWEWRYLWQLTRSSALVTLTNRPVRGCDVSFSQDGDRLAASWDDGRVELWDVPGRRLIRALTDSEYVHPAYVAFSPVRNLLAANSKPNAVALYDLDSRQESILWRAPDKGAWQVRDLAFSKDGSKLVIYAASSGNNIADNVSVVNVSSSKIESCCRILQVAGSPYYGAARLSPDNQRLYLARSVESKYSYSIRCLDLATGQDLWETEGEPGMGLTALDISPDGRVLASGSGFEDPTVRVWEAATGRPLARLEGHSGWVSKLVFSGDGRCLISSSSDQSIRFWDAGTWAETQVLRGHSNEVHSIAISQAAQLVASAGKDGNLMLWRMDAKSATDVTRRLPENLARDVIPLDHSRVLLLSPDRPPALLDLKGDTSPQSAPGIEFTANRQFWCDSNILCHWDGTNQILVSELRGSEFIQRGAIMLGSGVRPLAVVYNIKRQLVSWNEGLSSNSLHAASLASPGRHLQFKSDVPGLVPWGFSEDGNYLAASTMNHGNLRVWNVEAGGIVLWDNRQFRAATFAAGGGEMIVAIRKRDSHEIQFTGITPSNRIARRVSGRGVPLQLAVSPDGRLVALSTDVGDVRLYDPAKGELIEAIDAHLNAATGLAFSADGRRLISMSGGREAVKLWDVGTRQELLTFGGTGPLLQAATWSADGDAILAGRPWQAWLAPSWEEIAAVEARERAELQRP